MASPLEEEFKRLVKIGIERGWIHERGWNQQPFEEPRAFHVLDAVEPPASSALNFRVDKPEPPVYGGE